MEDGPLRRAGVVAQLGLAVHPGSGRSLPHEQPFDGTILCAKVRGNFEVPQAPATGDAPIDGEVSIVVPVRVQ
jgi:hypothetical protein